MMRFLRGMLTFTASEATVVSSSLGQRSCWSNFSCRHFQHHVELAIGGTYASVLLFSYGAVSRDRGSSSVGF